MARLIDVYNKNGSLLQRFICSSSKQPSHEIEEVIHDSHISTVAVCAETGRLIKLIKPRTWHEKLKFFWGKSRLHLEYRGSKLLKDAGIEVPKLYDMGIRYPWQFQSEYIGYYVMENLFLRDARCINSLIGSEEISREQIEKIASLLAQDLKKMRVSSIIYTDLRLENIFVSKNCQKIFFIDTGAKFIKNPEQAKLKLEKSVNKFLSLSTTRTFFQTTDIEKIKSILEK